MTDKSLPDDAESLLPWYATGTLNEKETDRVADELDAAPQGQRLLEDELTLAQRAADAAPGLADVLDRKAESYRQLNARMLAASEVPVDKPATTRKGARSWTAAASVCIAAAVALTWLLADRPAEYTTLTQPTGAQHRLGVQVLVRASGEQRNIQRVAQQLGASIISGPSERGVYLIALPIGADINRDVTWLRAQPEVLFAEAELR